METRQYTQCTDKEVEDGTEGAIGEGDMQKDQTPVRSRFDLQATKDRRIEVEKTPHRLPESLEEFLKDPDAKDVCLHQTHNS